mmetsp:Transcript_68505/g.191037  ORF Transcript_68505/g.191037 Transcript_68505/m.191037 type:complete len:240 (-) Transcript_68505:136-855(-)
MVDAPPAAWCTRVVGRSVMELPLFWFAPLAKAFEETQVPDAPELPKQIDDVPPGACGKRDRASGVATTCLRSSMCWLMISPTSSLPKQIVASPPTAPRAPTTAITSELSPPKQSVDAPPGATRMHVEAPSAMSDGTSSAPKQMDEVPPGACLKRGAASGVSITISRCSLCSPNVSLGSTSPRTTVAVPPVACWNRGAALGVSWTISRSAMRELKIACVSSVPSMTLASPPTGPLTARPA